MVSNRSCEGNKMIVRASLSESDLVDIGPLLQIRVSVESLGHARDKTQFRYKVLLFPTKTPGRFQRAGFEITSKGNRKHIRAICAHGYYHFARTLFEKDPYASIVSSLQKR